MYYRLHYLMLMQMLLKKIIQYIILLKPSLANLLYILSGWVNVFFPLKGQGSEWTGTSGEVFNRFCEPYSTGGLYLSKLLGETDADLKAEKNAHKSFFGRTDGTEGRNIESFPSGCNEAPMVHKKFIDW